MARRSLTPHIAFAGPFATAAALPNVAASPTQNTYLDAGDQAFVSADGSYWVCTDATLGAAQWVQLSASPSTIIYRPGGTPSTNVVTTYPALKAAVAAFPGPVTVVFDDSIVTPITLPAGAWVVDSRMTWRGLGDYINPVQIELADGFTATSVSGQCALGAFFGDAKMTGLSVTVPPFPVTLDSTMQVHGSALGTAIPILIGGAAGAPLFHANGAQLGVDLYGAQLGTYVFLNAATLYVGIYDGSIIPDHCFVGSNSINLVAADSSVSISYTQADIAGGVLPISGLVTTLQGRLIRTHRNVTHATGPITLNAYDQIVRVDTSTGTIGTITLPGAAVAPGLLKTLQLSVFDIGLLALTNNITINAPGGGTIDGGASIVINWNGGGVALFPDNGLDWYTPTASGVLAGAVVFSGGISPAQLTSQTDNWAPTGLSGAERIRFSTDATRLITGLTGGVSGRIIELQNVGSQAAVLMSENTSSTAANRFLMADNAILLPNEVIRLTYDGTSSRWRAPVVPYSPADSLGQTPHQWVQPSGLISSGGNVVRWMDDSGFGQPMTTLVGTPTVGVVANSLSGVITNGTNQGVAGKAGVTGLPTIFPDGYQFHIFAVVQMNTNGGADPTYYNNPSIYGDTGGRLNFVYIRSGGVDYAVLGAFDGAAFATPASGAAAAPQATTCILEGWLDPTDMKLRIRVNNGATVVAASPLTTAYQVASLDTIQIGHAVAYCAVKFGEGLCCTRKLTSTEAMRYRAFLTARWNIVT